LRAGAPELVISKSSVRGVANASRGVSYLGENNPQDFACPQCESRYKLIREKAGLRTSNRPVRCRVCGHVLASREGEDMRRRLVNAGLVSRMPELVRAGGHFIPLARFRITPAGQEAIR